MRRNTSSFLVGLRKITKYVTPHNWWVARNSTRATSDYQDVVLLLNQIARNYYYYYYCTLIQDIYKHITKTDHVPMVYNITGTRILWLQYVVHVM